MTGIAFAFRQRLRKNEGILRYCNGVGRKCYKKLNNTSALNLPLIYFKGRFVALWCCEHVLSASYCGKFYLILLYVLVSLWCVVWLCRIAKSTELVR